jgi:tellurite resistance protein TehA-like permease
MSDIVLYGIVGLMFYQAYVTIRLVRSKSFPPEKKWRQALFIWLIPFIGAAATLAVLAADKSVVPQKPNDRSH